MKVIVSGGVAGGASSAARLRRLNEKAEILMVERGPYVSYANCGLPYASRILLQHGFKARSISGGMLSRSILLAE